MGPVARRRENRRKRRARNGMKQNKGQREKGEQSEGKSGRRKAKRKQSKRKRDGAPKQLRAGGMGGKKEKTKRGQAARMRGARFEPGVAAPPRSLRQSAPTPGPGRRRIGKKRAGKCGPGRAGRSASPKQSPSARETGTEKPKNRKIENNKAKTQNRTHKT